ncbi:SMD3 [Candida oxycetoniae]|uniref:Small nuclear ribonucleoprotein Sm D3 n=1 Tax=Candida oxycetoniae TaxID=497107 RepID=A0AAI9SUJ9_9ASCO|nr:SMD3 [Candida oxycetoniae]KAI3403336.1 SMD3 [Candida oxycetoniae]
MPPGIPVRLLNEAQGHVVSIELQNGDTYRGKLFENEDNMNSTLLDVSIINGKDGSVTHMEQVFIRGSMIRFISLPDILRNAPMFYMKPGDKPKPPIRGPPLKKKKY